jgi:hypothetical protein
MFSRRRDKAPQSERSVFFGHSPPLYLSIIRRDDCVGIPQLEQRFKGPSFVSLGVLYHH